MNKNCITTKKNSNNGLKPSLRSNQNTFVHKLGTLINDPNIQDSIYWNTDGRSFTVKNIDKFSKTVLPLHFKHNNFSSFIRQLNMYGFHKVNRSPRGHRSDPAFQTWEFSHKLFVRDKLEQINDIKRTTNDADSSMKNSPSPDIHSQVALMYSQQKEMVNTIHSMSNEILQLRRELSEANRVQQVQQQVIRKITNHLQNINSSSNNNNNNNINNSNNNQLVNSDQAQPTIFITPPQAQNNSNMYNSLSPMPHNGNSPIMTQGQDYYFNTSMNQEFQNNMLNINNMNLSHLSPGLAPLGSEHSYTEEIKFSPRSPIVYKPHDNFYRSNISDSNPDEVSPK